MKHFVYYPKIEYGNEIAINIMVRGKIRDLILSQSALYYKYVVEDGERPDIIATKYYGNPLYTWAIFYANEIFNPLFDWPLNSQDFIRYIEKKYGSIEEAQNELNTPHHYEYIDPESNLVYIIDEETYNNTDAANRRKVSVFSYEQELNESKRNILVLDKAYILQIENELRKLFK